MLRKIADWLLIAIGFALLLTCAVFCLVIPSAAAKESHPLLTTFGMLTLFCFPTGTIGFYLVKWAKVPLPQKLARGLTGVLIALAFFDLCRATTPKVYVPTILLLAWLGGSYYYLRYMDGWSTVPARVRQRLTNAFTFWVYGVLHAMALVLVNVLWLILTAGRGGFIQFGGGRSGGAGASEKW